MGAINAPKPSPHTLMKLHRRKGDEEEEEENDARGNFGN